MFRARTRIPSGIPGLGRTGVSRVDMRIGCEDGFVLGDCSLTCD